MKCKITKKKALPVMSFGRMPLANGFLKKKILKKNISMNLIYLGQKAYLFCS